MIHHLDIDTVGRFSDTLDRFDQHLFNLVFSLSVWTLFLFALVSSGQHAFLSTPKQFASLVCVCQDRPGGHHGDLRLLETPCENPHV